MNLEYGIWNLELKNMPSKDSKTNFALLRNQILEQNGKEYWRSVEEFVDAPEFEEKRRKGQEIYRQLRFSKRKTTDHRPLTTEPLNYDNRIIRADQS